jgi:hypothetical protein
MKMPKQKQSDPDSDPDWRKFVLQETKRLGPKLFEKKLEKMAHEYRLKQAQNLIDKYASKKEAGK